MQKMTSPERILHIATYINMQKWWTLMSARERDGVISVLKTSVEVALLRERADQKEVQLKQGKRT